MSFRALSLSNKRARKGTHARTARHEAIGLGMPLAHTPRDSEDSLPEPACRKCKCETATATL